MHKFLLTVVLIPFLTWGVWGAPPHFDLISKSQSDIAAIKARVASLEKSVGELSEMFSLVDARANDPFAQPNKTVEKPKAKPKKPSAKPKKPARKHGARKRGGWIWDAKKKEWWRYKRGTGPIRTILRGAARCVGGG